MILAETNPIEHVLPHRFFEILPFNFNFGAEQIPLLSFPLSNTFWFTNQLLMTLIAAALCLLIFPRLARAYRSVGAETAPRGVFMNFFEAMLQFIREEVARPVLKDRTDRFMPFLWTLFFFILFCNLLGLVPLADIIKLATGGRIQHAGGTATGNLAITGGLAICAFLMIHVSGVGETYQALVAGTHGLHEEEHEVAGGHGPGYPTGELGVDALAMELRRPKPASPLKAILLALPLYVWTFAPHVFAQETPRPRPTLGLRFLMLPVYVILMGAEMVGIFGLLAGPAGRVAGAYVGAAFGVVAALGAGGLHWSDLLDAPMWGFLWLLEAIGALIKPFALMIRLFANMVAGHIVLASILALIFAANSVVMGYTVAGISTFGSVALSCLELFVAFLQAYIFVFLTTLFISMAVAPEH